MRPGPNSRRARGRNNGGGSGGGGGGNGSQQRRSNSLPNRNQTIDSNGPDIRIRGNVFQVYDKYMGLARDAQSSGDRVMAENYQQHAEHYVRIINAMNEAYGQPQQPPSDSGMTQPGSYREQPGVDADYDPLTSPQPQQRREYEAPRNDGGDRQPQQPRREYEPRNDGRSEGGDRPGRDRDQNFRDRDQGPREQGGSRDQNFRDRGDRPPRDRDQNSRDQNRGDQNRGDQQGQQRDRFAGPRDGGGRPDYRNERSQQPTPPDVHAPQPHVPNSLGPNSAEGAASASFGADPRDQEDSRAETELALPASIVARPRRGRAPRNPAPVIEAPVAPAAPPVAPVAATDASAQPPLPGVTTDEASPAPKRRPGRPRKVKPAVDGSNEPSSS